MNNPYLDEIARIEGKTKTTGNRYLDEIAAAESPKTRPGVRPPAMKGVLGGDPYAPADPFAGNVREEATGRVVPQSQVQDIRQAAQSAAMIAAPGIPIIGAQAPKVVKASGTPNIQTPAEALGLAKPPQAKPKPLTREQILARDPGNKPGQMARELSKKVQGARRVQVIASPVGPIEVEASSIGLTANVPNVGVIQAPNAKQLKVKIEQAVHQLRGDIEAQKANPNVDPFALKNTQTAGHAYMTDRQKQDAVMRDISDLTGGAIQVLKDINPLNWITQRAESAGLSVPDWLKATQNIGPELGGRLIAGTIGTPAFVGAKMNVLQSDEFTPEEKFETALGLLLLAATSSTTPLGPSLLDDLVRFGKGSAAFDDALKALEVQAGKPVRAEVEKVFAQFQPKELEGYTSPATLQEAGVKPKLAVKGQAGAQADITGNVKGPVTIPYIRNPKKSPNLGATYGQDVEPAGRYITEGERPPEGWESGTITFENPLIIEFGGGYGDPTNWKRVLSAKYGGKTGKDLSEAIARDGHDAIITVDNYGTSEIVDLTAFKKKAKSPPVEKPEQVLEKSPNKSKPLEDIGGSDDATGLANQQAAREREAGKLGEEVNLKGKSKEELHREGKRKYESGEIDIESTMRRLSDEGRSATGVEYGAALEHKRRLVQRQERAIKALDEAISAGRRTDLGRLKQELLDTEEAVTKWQNLVDESKTAWSDSGRGLQIGSTINEGSLADVLQARARRKGVSVAELSKAEKAGIERQVKEFQAKLKEAGVDYDPTKQTLDEALENWRKRVTPTERVKAEELLRTASRRPRAKTIDFIRKQRAEAASRILARVAKSGSQLGAGPGQAFSDLLKAAPEIVEDVKIVIRSIADEFQIRVLDKKLFDAVRNELPGVDISDDEIVKVLAGEWDEKVKRTTTLYQELSKQARKMELEPVLREKARLAEDLKQSREAVKAEERRMAQETALLKQSKEVAAKKAQEVEDEAARSLKQERKRRAEVELADARKRRAQAEKAMRAAEREAEQGPIRESRQRLEQATQRMKELEGIVERAVENEKIVANAIEEAKRAENTRVAENALSDQRKKLVEQQRKTKALEDRLATLEDLEDQIRYGEFDKAQRRVKNATKDQQRLDLLISARRRQINQMVNAKDQSKFEKYLMGGANLLRSAKLGSDAGMLLRQGLFTLGRGRATIEGLRNFVRALGSDDTWDVINESYFFKEAKDGRLLEPLRKEARLATSDVRLDPEEIRALQLFKKIPIFKGFVGALERGQSAFINTVRREIFDDFVNKFPDASIDELKARARFINAATGRSNLESVPKALQILMTSPRYTASRWEIVGEYLRNPAAALTSKAARENLKDLAGTAASIAASLKLMEALGYEVDWNPFSSDFLKVRRGGVVYDPTAGAGKVLRTAIRISAFMSGARDPGFKENAKEEFGKMFSDTISPAFSAIQSRTGKSLGGYDLKPTERGWWVLTPLLVSGFAEGVSQEGAGQSLRDAIPEFFGVGVSRYPKPKKKN